jgi:hypothetical protein
MTAIMDIIEDFLISIMEIKSIMDIMDIIEDFPISIMEISSIMDFCLWLP